MSKKRYSAVLFIKPEDREGYEQLIAWERNTRNNLLLAKLTAPTKTVHYCIFRYQHNGNFSILANSLTAYTSYEHCFAYTRNTAFLSYRKTDNKFYYKGNSTSYGIMFRFLIAKRFKTKMGLDFLRQEDIFFIQQSTSLMHRLFSKEITCCMDAWKYYLQQHNITGNIDYKKAYLLYVEASELNIIYNNVVYVELFFKFLYTSSNLQRDINFVYENQLRVGGWNSFETLLNNSYLLQQKVNYAVSRSSMEKRKPYKQKSYCE